MVLSEEQWFGEEASLAQMPIIYDAVAESDVVRVFRINGQEILQCFGEEDRKHVKTKMWLRLKFIFDRVKATHKIKELVLDEAPSTQLIPLTINHIEATNPNSSRRAQHQLRNMTLDRVGNKGEYVLFQDNAL
jgi:CRP-like cAMP-binding protein